MVSDQEFLANIVKGLHKKLRKDLKKAGGDYKAVWEKHCFDQESLQQYATAMHSLATGQWTNNSPGGRANWCFQTCMEYFKDGGLKMTMEKQKQRIDDGKAAECCCCMAIGDKEHMVHQYPASGKKLLLLDVGSCYNPFFVYEEFASVAIDLQPATELVYKCDFLSLEVITIDANDKVLHNKCSKQDQVNTFCSSKKENKDNHSCNNVEESVTSPEYAAKMYDSKLNLNSNEQFHLLHLGHTENSCSEKDLSTFLKPLTVSQLPGGTFNVVLFSLLLSYFPSPIQRWECCVKAHKLLTVNGILIIITPDSSHQNRNAAMVKSWKLAIESIGFIRWKYIKDTHVHCMVFRKVAPCHHSYHGNSNVKDISPDMMYTRQDCHDDDDSDSDGVYEVIPRTEEENNQVSDLFDELPIF